MKEMKFSVSDLSLIEPKNEDDRLSFIHSVTMNHGINAIHTGRNCKWFESQRDAIQSPSVSLTTGATGTEWFELADEKVTFSEFMAKKGLRLYHLFGSPLSTNFAIC